MSDTLVAQPSPPRPTPVAPRLADVTLFGEYEGSGFKEPPYLARRADGQVVQLSRLLYLVAANADGKRSLEQIAARVSVEFGRIVSADNVRFLVENKLRPLGVIADDSGQPQKLERANPLLGLRFKVGLVPEGTVRAISAVFWPLFLTPVVVAVLGGLIAVDVWLFFHHGLIESVEQILYQPSLIFVLFLLETASAAFHEFGHASASRYGGARTGVIGVGIYIVFMVFYSDATDSYRLSKRDRLRVDLGGLYFDAVFSLAMAGAYFLTGFEPLLVLVLFNQLGALDEFSPFLRYDGYYVVSDLIGVPDLFGRIKPIMLSLIPGRPASERVTELKPWARAVVTVWVLLAVPLLLVSLVLLIVLGPEILSRAWRSLLMQSGTVSRAFEAGSITDVVGGVIQIGALLTPAVGGALFVALVLGRLGSVLIVRYRGAAAARRGSVRDGSEGRRPLLHAGLLVTSVAATAAAAGFILLFLWSPVGDHYGPVQRIESDTFKGTLDVPGEIVADRPANASEGSTSEARPSGGRVRTEGADSSRGVGAGEPSGTEDGPGTGQEPASDAAPSPSRPAQAPAPAPSSPAPAPNAAAPNAPAPNAPSPNAAGPAPSFEPAQAPAPAPSSPAPAPNAPAPNAPAPNAPAPNAPAPNAPTPNQAAPNAPTPNQAAPNAPTPNQAAPNQAAPNAPTPNQAAPPPSQVMPR